MSRGQRRKRRFRDNLAPRYADSRLELCSDGLPHAWVRECPRCDLELCLVCMAERGGRAPCQEPTQ